MDVIVLYQIHHQCGTPVNQSKAIFGVPAHLKHVDEEPVKYIQYLFVALMDGHLQIQTSKLAEVAMGIAVFGTEDGADLKHALHVTADGHLLVELGGLQGRQNQREHG